VSLVLTGEGAERLEASLLNMFGLKKRPRPRREAINVPEFLIELYRHQTGLEVDTTNFDLRGKLTQTANTVRTFAHEEDEGNPLAFRAPPKMRMFHLFRCFSFFL
jgi:hypothetical protein